VSRTAAAGHGPSDAGGGPAREQMLPIASGVTLHLVHWDPHPDAPTVTDRPPVLLVHGLASNARLWDGVARLLVAHGHPVIAVDQRGHGRSSKPDGGYDVATVADDLALLIDALGLDRPVVAGQSWGGNVVIELAARHRTAARAVVPVDGGLIDLRARFPDLAVVEEVLAPPRLAGVPWRDLEAMVRRFAADWPDRGAGSLANFEHRDDGTAAPWLTFERHLTVLRGLWDHRPFERLAAIDVPVHLVVADARGPEATWKREAVDRALAVLPRGRATWFPDAHHDVHAQHPDRVAAIILDEAGAAAP
jgi:pimeloyl-ACP methyl ester carboxylesterase